MDDSTVRVKVGWISGEEVKTFLMTSARGGPVEEFFSAFTAGAVAAHENFAAELEAEFDEEAAEDWLSAHARAAGKQPSNAAAAVMEAEMEPEGWVYFAVDDAGDMVTAPTADLDGLIEELDTPPPPPPPGAGHP